MKNIIEQKEAHVKYRGDLKVVEYPNINKDVSIIYAELNGRHPANGYIINRDSNETYLVHEGSGKIYMDGVITEFKAGDVVPIKKGTRYYCVGKNMKFWCAINPPWESTQEQVVSWFDVKDFVIDWRITSKCINNCKYCYAAEKINQVSPEEEGKIIDVIVSSGCKTVCISGGEPLIDFNRANNIIDKLYMNNVSIYLSTTGFNFLENIEKIEGKISKLSLSLDGYDKTSHSTYGRSEIDFDRVIKILEYLKNNKHNFSIKIGTILTNKNLSIDYFEKMYEVLKNYNISLWKIYEFIPESRGSQNYEELKIPRLNFARFKRKFNQVFSNKEFPIKLITRKRRSSAYFIIQPDGSVIIPQDKQKSLTKDILIGDLKKETINDILLKWSKNANKKRSINNWNTRTVLKN